MEEAKWALVLDLVEVTEPFQARIMNSVLDVLLAHGTIEPILFPFISSLEAEHGREATAHAIDVMDRYGLLSGEECELLRQCMCV